MKSKLEMKFNSFLVPIEMKFVKIDAKVKVSIAHYFFYNTCISREIGFHMEVSESKYFI